MTSNDPDETAETPLAKQRRWTSERGAVMAEYGLLIALIALMVVSILIVFLPNLASIFTAAGAGMDTTPTP